jgi:hypothetical protein
VRCAWALAVTVIACGDPASLGIGDDLACGEPGRCVDPSTWTHEYRQRSKYGAIGASALAIAGDGDIVASGTYSGSFEVAGQVHTSVDEVDIWVARFAPDGAPRWFRGFVGEPTETGHGGAPWSAGNLTFAANDDILLSSTVFATIDLGTGPLVGDTPDPVVLRMSPAGAVIWARRIVGPDEPFNRPSPVFVAPADDDRVWLVGTVHGTVDLGGEPLWSAGWGDLLVAQLDGAGEHLWSRRHGDAGHQEARAVAPAPDGGVVITGELEGSLTIADTTITSAGLGDAFLLRLDAAGALLWARRFGDELGQTGEQVVVDAAGVTFAGDFIRAIDLGGGPLTTERDPHAWEPADAWQRAIFVARLDLAGDPLWSTALRADSDPASLDMLARGDDGSLALAGWSGRRMQFAGEIAGTGDGPWFAALTAEGEPLWLQTASGSPRVAIDADGGVIAVFDLRDPIDFAGAQLGAAGRASLIVARRGPEIP